MTRAALARRAVAHTFFTPTDLRSAIDHLGYVQADPIRAPARAQDFILFQRVDGYRSDALERRYATLDLIEDTIFNYGFFPRRVRDWLHPRTLSPNAAAFIAEHKGLRRRVMAHLERHGEAHLRDLEAKLGAGRRVNGWGGTSAATTLMLETLHKLGRVEVKRRDNGIRVYGLARKQERVVSPNARADGLIGLMAALYAPIPESTLLTIARSMQRCRAGDFETRYRKMVTRGVLRRESVDGKSYVWPSHGLRTDQAEARVRLLTPFDPLVWDRKRFVHLWGWDYRFEAYTPIAKRRLGYYALPMLWKDDVIGWANAELGDRGLRIEYGLAKALPRGEGVAFREALETEGERLKLFLGSRKKLQILKA